MEQIKTEETNEIKKIEITEKQLDYLCYILQLCASLTQGFITPKRMEYEFDEYLKKNGIEKTKEEKDKWYEEYKDKIYEEITEKDGSKKIYLKNVDKDFEGLLTLFGFDKKAFCDGITDDVYGTILKQTNEELAKRLEVEEQTSVGSLEDFVELVLWHCDKLLKHKDSKGESIYHRKDLKNALEKVAESLYKLQEESVKN